VRRPVAALAQGGWRPDLCRIQLNRGRDKSQPTKAATCRRTPRRGSTSIANPLAGRSYSHQRKLPVASNHLDMHLSQLNEWPTPSTGTKCQHSGPTPPTLPHHLTKRLRTGGFTVRVVSNSTGRIQTQACDSASLQAETIDCESPRAAASSSSCFEDSASRFEPTPMNDEHRRERRAGG